MQELSDEMVSCVEEWRETDRELDECLAIVRLSEDTVVAVEGRMGSKRYRVRGVDWMKRIVKRVVRLEIEELYIDGSTMSDVIEVRTTDEVNRAKSIDELTAIAKKELTKND